MAAHCAVSSSCPFSVCCFLPLSASCNPDLLPSVIAAQEVANFPPLWSGHRVTVPQDEPLPAASLPVAHLVGGSLTEVNAMPASKVSSYNWSYFSFVRIRKPPQTLASRSRRSSSVIPTYSTSSRKYKVTTVLPGGWAVMSNH